jgi:hypothetical protein
LTSPLLAPDEFGRLVVSRERTVHFHNVLPVHADEMKYKLRHGFEALIGLFAKDRALTRPPCAARIRSPETTC